MILHGFVGFPTHVARFERISQIQAAIDAHFQRARVRDEEGGAHLPLLHDDA